MFKNVYIRADADLAKVDLNPSPMGILRIPASMLTTHRYPQHFVPSLAPWRTA